MASSTRRCRTSALSRSPWRMPDGSCETPPIERITARSAACIRTSLDQLAGVELVHQDMRGNRDVAFSRASPGKGQRVTGRNDPACMPVVPQVVDHTVHEHAVVPNDTSRTSASSVRSIS